MTKIIIVAGGQDGTLEYAISHEDYFKQFKQFSVIKQEPSGKNAALKKGIEKVDDDTEIIILVDADTKVDKNWLKKMIQHCQKHHIAA